MLSLNADIKQQERKLPLLFFISRMGLSDCVCIGKVLCMGTGDLEKSRTHILPS